MKNKSKKIYNRTKVLKKENENEAEKSAERNDGRTLFSLTKKLTMDNKGQKKLTQNYK